MEQYHIFKLGLAVIFYAAYCVRPVMVDGIEVNDLTANTAGKIKKADDYYVYYQGVQGKPGVDFPVHSHIPRTSFTCRDVESGYYADLDTNCQVFHICEDGKKISFLCPNGTIFQQSDLICEWWFKVNCTSSPFLYEESAEHLREDSARRKSSRRVVFKDTNENYGAVMRTEEQSSVSAIRNRKIDETKNVQKNLENNKKIAFNRQNSLDRRITHDYGATYSTTQSNSPRENTPTPYIFQISDIHNGDERGKPKQNRNINKDVNRFDNSPSTQYHSTTTQRIIKEIKTTANYATNSQINQLHYQKPETNIKYNVNSGQFVSNYYTPVNKTVDNAGKTKSSENQRFNKNEYDILTSNKLDPKEQLEDNSKNKANNINTQNQYVFIGAAPINISRKPSGVSSNIPNSASHSITINTLPRNGKASKNKDKTRYTLKVQNTLFTGSINKNDTKVNNSTINSTNTIDQIPQQNGQTDDKDESQITQETASIYKNGFNAFSNNIAHYSTNAYPNHRETYSDVKDPKYYNEKYFSKISSVTPQYVTLQTINNGKPFLGSRVGTTINSVFPTSQHSTNPVIEYTTVASVQYPTEARGKFNNYDGKKSDTAFSAVGNNIVTSVKYNNTNSKPIDDPGDETVSVESLITTPNPPFYNRHRQSSVILPTQKSAAIGLGTIVVEEMLPTVEPTTRTTPRRIVDHATVYGTFSKTVSTTPITTFDDEVKINVHNIPVATENKHHSFGKADEPTRNSISGFFLTKPVITTTTSTPLPSTSDYYYSTEVPSSTSTTDYLYQTLKTNVARPRPFEHSATSEITTDLELPIVFSTLNTKNDISSHNYYKISTASPFSVNSYNTEVESTTRVTTEPTPADIPENSHIIDNVDSMINALKEFSETSTEDRSSEIPRPGLIVPPSVGPQTLHTLAVYFANALDGIANERDDTVDKADNEEVNKIMEEKLTALLTHMTKSDYEKLFRNDKNTSTDSPIETTTYAEVETENDLEAQHSKNPVQMPHVRQLARVFTQALSAYLDDPATFRRVLEEVRPTEPPNNEDASGGPSADDELLNFSDADSKSSYPPIYPTSPSMRPTWGFVLAPSQSKNTVDDVKNSLNGETENLQSADSQSFVSQFNYLTEEEKKATFTHQNPDDDLNDLPSNHWTSSPDATKLWRSTFAVNPSLINKHLDTTEPFIVSTTEHVDSIGSVFAEEAATSFQPDHRDIKYELRSLPKIDLNSSQVHGILIDFMNHTTDQDADKLHRILRKLNTTESEFLDKMKEIEENPLTRRLILLLINECGTETKDLVETRSAPVESLLNLANTTFAQNYGGSTDDKISNGEPIRQPEKFTSGVQTYVDPKLTDDDHDARALQLLNSLYSIASRFGK